MNRGVLLCTVGLSLGHLHAFVCGCILFVAWLAWLHDALEPCRVCVLAVDNAVLNHVQW